MKAIPGLNTKECMALIEVCICGMEDFDCLRSLFESALAISMPPFNKGNLPLDWQQHDHSQIFRLTKELDERVKHLKKIMNRLANGG